METKYVPLSTKSPTNTFTNGTFLAWLNNFFISLYVNSYSLYYHRCQIHQGTIEATGEGWVGTWCLFLMQFMQWTMWHMHNQLKNSCLCLDRYLFCTSSSSINDMHIGFLYILYGTLQRSSVCSCGRTARNSTLLETLIFHQTLSTPKASYIRRFHRAHPKGELKQSMFFLQDPIMRTSLQYLVHFIQQKFSEIHYYNTKFRVRNLNSGIKINI